MGYDLTQEKVQYVVAGSHLDTQWRWTIQQTVDEYLVRTMLDHFALLEQFPDYVFSFEGAYRYMLIQAHYPAEYEQLKRYVESGRWAPVGSMVDMPDVNMPCPESLVRQVLYGNLFFEREFGLRCVDIYLPDCFGFGLAFPTIMAHCGLVGFSSWKLLSWRGGTYRDEAGEVQVGIPFDIGVWEGVDGSAVIAALNPGHYMGKWEPRTEDLARVHERTGLWLNFHYFGVGDRGGAQSEENVRELMERAADPGGVRVVVAPSHQMYLDLTPEQIARLPRYRGELICTQAAGGYYTAESRMKTWNRRCEQRADSAERVRVMADWLGALSYPRAALEQAWIGFLWHQMHDDLAGVSLPEAHDISERDYRRSHLAFSTAETAGLKALAGEMDTRAEGRACLVYNGLSHEREDVVTVQVDYGRDAVPEQIEVVDPLGSAVPSEIVTREGSTLTVSFLARVPALGVAAFDIRPSAGADRHDTGLRADEQSLENARYQVRIDENGDVCSILDKAAGKELLSAPLRLELLDDDSPRSPAWNIEWDTIRADPVGYVGAPAAVTVESSGPLTARLRIERTAGGPTGRSTVVQRVTLAAGGAGDRLEIETTIEWGTHERLLKAAFPLAVANPWATYDLGLGVVQRGNNSQKMHEVPAQQWADLTGVDGSYGVSILSDCKYGWDKPQDNVLRLTLLHTPRTADKHPEQAELDVGRTHRLRYAVAGHPGDWRDGGTVALGQRFNQPLQAVIVGSNDGPLGRRFGFLETSGDPLSVMALKKAERTDDIVLRVRETRGQPLPGAWVRFAGEVVSAVEVDGQELPKGEVSLAGSAIHFDLAAFQPKAFAIRLKPYRC